MRPIIDVQYLLADILFSDQLAPESWDSADLLELNPTDNTVPNIGVGVGVGVAVLDGVMLVVGVLVTVIEGVILVVIEGVIVLVGVFVMVIDGVKVGV